MFSMFASVPAFPGRAFSGACLLALLRR